MEFEPQERPRVGRSAAARWTVSAVLVVGLGAVVGGMQLSGHGLGSRPSREGGEIRLTHDGISKFAARFSPDGRWIAYTAGPAGQKESWGVYLVPRQGGEARRLSPDSVGMVGLAWSADGKGVYCRGLEAGSIYYLGTDGRLRTTAKSGTFDKLVGISPDGQTQLLLRFNGDNPDLGVQRPGGRFEFVAVTPGWESEATFGPGAGELTVVASPSYQAPVTSISVWSPKTHAFTPLPLPEGQNSQPAWSPDGRFLIYSSFRNGRATLWAYDAQTARSAPLTSFPGDAGCPSWSRDGQWLAFCLSTKTSHLLCGNPQRGEIRPLTAGPALDYLPVVSHDGRWVAFVRRPAPSPGAPSEPTLCVMPAAGGPVTELDLEGVSLVAKDGDAISWSHDDLSIAFQGRSGPGRLDIYRIGRDGQGLARVTMGSGEELAPGWSPDGRHIAYTQAGGGRLEVQAIPANGGVPRTLSQAGAMCEGCAWAPDSDRLAYTEVREDGNFRLWLVRLDRPEARRPLLEDKTVVWPLFWSRDGREIVLARGPGPQWRFTAYVLEARREIPIGRSVMLPSGREGYVELSSQGEKYRKLFYPAGMCVFADGKESADIYLVKVKGLIESRLLAAQAE